jgi:prepilin signal peptidase PulO-like enzyme (type II secretory pathway)
MTIICFIFGTVVGSFVNVIVSRFGKERKWWQGRSYCDNCQRQLKWWENIPIFSYLFFGGRCRTCHSPIPFEYPLVELATGVFYSFIIYHFKFENILLITRPQRFACMAGVAVYLLLVTLLIIVFLYDLHYQIIPDWAVLGLVSSALLIRILNHPELVSGSLSLRFRNEFGMTILIGLASSVFFLILHLITRGRGMGLGDVKFAFFMGFFLGWPEILAAFYIAFLTGAVAGVILILMNKKKFGQHLAFGPFLVLATIVVWFFGGQLINWAQKFI